MIERCIVGMEGQRNKRLEAASLVLQGPQPDQVIDSVLIVLDVAVEHRGIRLQSRQMRLPRRLQPFVAIDLVVADDVPYAVGKDLRAAAWAGIHTSSLHPPQRLGNR